MALAEQADLVVSLSLRDGLARGIKGAETRIEALQKTFSRTGRSLDVFGRNIKLAGVAAAGAAGLSVKLFADFEDQLATINTVANVTDEELRSIGDGMRALATETGISLTEISSGYYDLVSAGVAAADAQLVLTNATTLAVGGLATTGETVDLLTTAINSYGLKASEVTTVTNGFAQAIAAGKVTASELASSFATVGPIAAASGIEIEELQAGYAQLTATGVPAAEASTQMRAAIVALKRPTGELQALQKKLGVDFEKVAKQKGLQVAYEKLRKSAQDLGIDETQLLGRVEALGFMYATTGERADKYRENLDAVRRSSEGSGVATEQFEKRQRTLNATFGRIRETGRDVALILGEELAPSIQRIAGAILTFVQENRPKIASFAEKVGDLVDSVTTDENISAGIEGALGFLRSMPWSAIGEGLRITGEAAKTAVSAFQSLDPGIQKTLIGVLAANKLTGGLVTSVLGDLAGVALRSLTTINAANVTVVAGNVTGTGTGGTGGTGAPVGTGGGGRTVGGVIRGVGAAAIGIGSVVAVIDQFQATSDQINLAQTNLRGNAEAAADFSGPKAISDLASFAKSLQNQNFEQSFTTNTFGATETGLALTNLGKAIVGDQSLTRGQLLQGLNSIEIAQKVANERGWPEVVSKLERNERTLELRLSKLDETTKSTGTATKTAIDALDLQVTVSATTNLSVSDMGEKVVAMSGGGRFLIR